MHCGFFPLQSRAGKETESRELVNVCLGHGGFQCVSEGVLAGGVRGRDKLGEEVVPSSLSPSPFFLRLGKAGSC